MIYEGERSFAKKGEDDGEIAGEEKPATGRWKAGDGVNGEEALTVVLGTNHRTRWPEVCFCSLFFLLCFC